MPTLVTLSEAASYLGVSKSTLRNWDREGKLKAYRHPVNNYRAFDLEELRGLRVQASFLDETTTSVRKGEPAKISDARGVRRVVARLHSILRDTDGGSSIIERFDELTKFLFLKLTGERMHNDPFRTGSEELPEAFAIRIRMAYEGLASENAGLFPKRFSRLKCSDEAILQCGAALGSVAFAGTSLDIKGLAYEEVIRGTFDKSDHQQFFTPSQIVEFMVSLVDPWLTGVVMDPAAGTGGFLASVARKKAAVQQLIGLEIDERLSWVTGINLLLHGAPNFQVECLKGGGALGPEAERFNGRLDLVLTNPPFGSDLQDQALLDRFALGRGRTARRRGILFLEACYAFLREGGVVGIILDEGVLTLPSAKDVRAFMLSHFDILGVISLPESAFMPYASVNASILVLRKSGAPGRNRRVFFARAEAVGRRPNGDEDLTYNPSGVPILNSDLPAILFRWQAALAGRDIGADDSAYVADVRSQAGESNALRLDFRFHHPTRTISRQLLDATRYPLSPLTDICDERNEVAIPVQELGDQVILYTGLAHIESGSGIARQVPTPAASLKSAVKLYEPGDIVFARMRPGLRKVALMGFDTGGYVSPECTVLTPRTEVAGMPLLDPVILATVLRSDLVYGQILHLIAGIGRPRLAVSDLRRVMIPVPPPEVQATLRAMHQARMASAIQLRESAERLRIEASAEEARAVELLAADLVGEEHA